MSHAPFPSNDGSELHDQAPSASLRLRDAESIAAERLDTGGDGSLKEALASVGPTDSPADSDGRPDDVERLTDCIEAAQARYHATAAEVSTLPFLAEPMPDGTAAEAPNLTLVGLRDWSEAQAAVAAELAEVQSQPLVAPQDAQQAIGTHWQPVARDADPYRHPPEGAPAQAAAAMPEPAVEPPGPEPQTSPAGAPIASALDAAAKLTADANAAAAALENLTRLLHNHQRPAAVVPTPEHVARRPPQPVPMPVPVPVLVPRPAPVAQQQRPAPRPPVAARKPATRTVKAPPLRPSPVPLESRQFDVRGFMAGFALSWAIGAVLYIYLMVG